MPHHPAHEQSPPPARRPAAPGTRAPRPLAPGQTVVFLGDSITAAQPGYVDVLEQALAHTRPDLRLRLVNAGVAGDTVRDLEARLDADALAAQPAWVVVASGTNDYVRTAREQPGGVALPEFAARYQALLARIRAAGAEPIVLTIPVIGNDDAEFPIPHPTAYNAAIRALAASEDVPLVDLYRAFHDVYERAVNYKQTLNLTTDGIHPNHQGHALIARTLLQHLGLLGAVSDQGRSRPQR